MDEKQLVLNAKNGDKDSFCALYSLYKDRLYRYALYRLSIPEDAEDAVSECICSAFKQINTIKKPEAFSAWLFTILRYSCNTFITRQSQSRNTVDINDCAETLTATNANITEKAELQQALDILKDDEKEIVLMSVVLGLNSKEVSKITGLTSGAVRSKLSRSLKKMKDFLGD